MFAPLEVVAVMAVLITQVTQGRYVKKEGNRCMYTTQDSVGPVECADGHACYAIVSVTHDNNTWKAQPYSLGCWENISSCTKNYCDIKLPNFIWVDHHFPRFCCCHGDYCNKNLKLDL